MSKSDHHEVLQNACGITGHVMVIPVLEQGSSSAVSYKGFHFRFDTTLKNYFTITQYLSDVTDQMPADAKHAHFASYSKRPPTDSIAGIRVYKIADLARYEYTQQVTHLQALLAERHELGQFTTLSANADAEDNTLLFLPVVAAGQIIRAPSRWAHLS
jgi:hypothetical protein